VRNEVAVVTVAERPTVVVDYTVDQPKLLTGAGRIFTQSDSGAYLLDGLFEISQGFKKREASRPVIVAISTNGPELSTRYHDQIVGALRGIGAAFSIEPTLTQSAYMRPHNRSSHVPGLYFVGAGTHPGGGIPGVLSSAKVLERVVPRPSPARGAHVPRLVPA